MPRAQSHRVRWHAWAIVLAVALTYANSLNGPFVLDDEAAVAQNPQIQSLSPGRALWPDAESPVAGRPLVNLSFALNYAAHGLDVRGYHIVNIVLHLTCALLALGLIRRTLQLPHGGGLTGGHAENFACAAALIWAVHPLNSEVVDYVTQRSESMMAACLLITIYAANRSVTDRRTGAWQAVAMVSCALGMLCKETMAIAPVLVALYDRVFVFESWKDAFRLRGRLYAGLAATWIVLAVVVSSAPRAGSVGLSSGVSPWTYLLNQTQMIARYLRLAVWPDQLVVFYGWPVPLKLGDVFPYALGLTVLAAATVVALVTAPVLGFLGAWFFLTLAPASSVVPIATEVGAERRMYLPLLSVVVLAVLLFDRIWSHWGSGRINSRRFVAIPALLVVGVAGALAATTVARNREYASRLSLAQSVVDRRPTGVAYHVLGEQLMTALRDADAVMPLTEAVIRGDTRAGYPLGVALANTGQLNDAFDRLDAFVRTSQLPYRPVPRWLEPPRAEVVRARVLMARILATRREWSAATEQAGEALTLAPADSEAKQVMVQALMNFGLARVAAGDINAAVEAFRRATELDPANEGARNLLAIALKDQQAAAAVR
jgi:tetratricopeptide (TPR) repeat protein